MTIANIPSRFTSDAQSGEVKMGMRDAAGVVFCTPEAYKQCA